jgi:nucleoside phosphorylase
MSAMPMTHGDSWICALPLEAAASKAMLDKTHPQLAQPTHDDNAYTLRRDFGALYRHSLPAIGTISAATVSAHMQTTFCSIRFGLMVGIGGGVPSTDNDIRLGDVVVSKPSGVRVGVVQYDYGKTECSKKPA